MPTSQIQLLSLPPRYAVFIKSWRSKEMSWKTDFASVASEKFRRTGLVFETTAHFGKEGMHNRTDGVCTGASLLGPEAVPGHGPCRYQGRYMLAEQSRGSSLLSSIFTGQLPRKKLGAGLHEVPELLCSWQSSPDGVAGREQLLAQQRMHSMISSVDVKSEVPVGLEPISPLDLRTDLRMMMPVVDPVVREKQLQQELLLIQQQQQIQKQLLIAEFQKQHENLTRQHQAQLQEHIKELLAIKQQQELLEKEQKLEQQRQEQEVERHRREQQLPPLRGKDRGRERAVASTEVKQKLQEFLLSKSATKDTPTNGKNHSVSRHPKLWAAHHTSLDQSSPPLSGTSPSYKYTLPGAQDTKDDFPLRKTESSVSSSSPGSGPSSPNNGPTGSVTENETSVLPPTPHAEQLVSQQRILIHDDSMNLLSLYTSPSLPNITLGLPAGPSQLNASNSLKEKQKCETQTLRQGVPLPGQYGGSVPASSSHPHVALEGKPNSSHQALLQHLLLKEQMRQQKLLVTGGVPLHPQSPLATKERISPGIRGTHKLPRHRPLNRTQSAPLPQSTLAQLVIQQQHQQFLEKQKQYQQQIHMNKLLSKSIEQLKQPGSHLEEAEEELQGDQAMQEDRAPSSDNSSRSDSSACVDDTLGQVGAVKVKEEPVDSDEDAQIQEMESGEQAAFMQQVIGKDLAPGFVIKVII
ncbi:histone deacetylase 9 isoform X18 [Marmota monax]|uniref:histone deacetylase 9 isoform X18 n=1 Tax=Marmota monax TaxID=9995 RepID=UPI001EB06C89|nr:histone deacetylase 9 isoform X18 [Marmota monax]